MNKRQFFKNTAVMTVTSLLLRTLGIVFRIFISNRIGAEGMGLYSLVFSVYVLGTTFAAAGLTTAVTRLCAEQIARNNRAGCRRVLRIGCGLSVLIGAVSGAALYVFAAPLGRLIDDVRTVPALAVSGIALPFIGLSSCLKGYFLARRRAAPPCLSQILEQLVRIGSILLLLRTAGAPTLGDVCRILILGDVLSESTACLFLLGAYGCDRKALPKNPAARAPTGRRTLRHILQIALPLTAGRYVSTGLRTVETVLVPARLTLFTRSQETSLSQFGAIKGMCLPLVFFPAAFLVTVSGLLVPELSDAHALGRTRQVTRLTHRSLRMTLPASVYIGCLFTVLGRPLGEILYHDPMVGLFLQILGPLTPVMYLDSVASALLRGLGEQVRSLWYSIADSLVRLLLIWFLLPRAGITGFLFVMLVSNLLTAGLSVHRLLTVSGARICWRQWVFAPTLVACLSGVAVVALREPLSLGATLPALVAQAALLTVAYWLSLPLFTGFPSATLFPNNPG